MIPLIKRLIAAKKKAELSIVDMATWFGVHKRTMATWLEGREPLEYKQAQVEETQDLLEKAIAGGGHFPVPLSVTQFQRKTYIERVKTDVSPRIPKARTAR